MVSLSSSMGSALPEHPRTLRCIPFFFEMFCVNNLVQIAIILVELFQDILELHLLFFFFCSECPLLVFGYLWVPYHMCKCFNFHHHVILLALWSWWFWELGVKRILVLDEIFTVCHIINLLMVPNKAYVSFLLAWLDRISFFVMKRNSSKVGPLCIPTSVW